jgi:ABC-2 type transport system permease protein
MRSSIERIAELVRKEFRQVFRDPRMRAIIFVAPLIQLVIFGYAVSTDVRNTPLHVVDYDNTAESRSVVEAMTSSGYFRLVGRSQDHRDVAKTMDEGRAVVAMVVPPGFSRTLRRGDASVQLVIDGTNSNVAMVARGYAERIVVDWGMREAGVELRPAIDLRERAWFNSELESRDYNVPGVAGLIIFLICLLLTALAIVRERELGTLEQLMVSPVRAWELIVGKSLPFAVLGLLDLSAVTAVAILWFDIPLRGSIPLLLLASLLYILTALGLGLFLSTISRTQQEAFMGMYLVFLPGILLSGYMFPVRSMPLIFQYLTLLNPIRHYMTIVRAIFLKGAGLGALWPSFLALLIIGVTVLAFSVGRFEKRVA